MVHPHRLIAILASLLLWGSAACFKSSTFEASSESSSNSASSPFTSSSKSSSDDDETARDVSRATELWAVRGGDVDSLRRDIGRIAREHGVSDWESYALTYQAIGLGLCRAQLGGNEVEAVKMALAAGSTRALEWIEAGYACEVPN